MGRTRLRGWVLLVSLGLAACGPGEVVPPQGDGGTTAPDAGVTPGPDAGTPDSGTPDSGTPDSGTPADPTEGQWRDGFSLPGAGGHGAQIRALVKGPDGRLYAGGSFSEIGTVPARSVAAWDGSTWVALGEGVPGHVNTLAFTADGTLYAGGLLADGPEVNTLMRWDGTSWQRVGDAFDGQVFELAAHGDGLLVGGFFQRAGELEQPGGLLRFDGTGFQYVGGKVEGAVEAFDVESAERFCMGGGFGSVAGVPANNVACWDGSAWTQLADGLPGAVSVLVRDAQGRHIAGGSLTFPVGYEEEGYRAGVAILREGSWTPLVGGVTGGYINRVRALAFLSDGSLLVGGQFRAVGVGTPFYAEAAHIARLHPPADGSGLEYGHWSEVGGGVRLDVGIFSLDLVGVHALVVEPADRVTAAGLFSSAGRTVAANVTRWQGRGFQPLLPVGVRTDGVSGGVMALVPETEGRLVVGGAFQGVGTVPASNVALRDADGTWLPMGAGLDGQVNVLLKRKDGTLVAGGLFMKSGEADVPFLARWNGQAWEAFTPPLDGTVNDIVEDAAGQLYVGGAFVKAGDVRVNRVARWDGTAWHPLQLGLADEWGGGEVFALALDREGSLYAGGTFTLSDLLTVRKVGRWDGTSWHPLSSGVDDEYGVVTRLALDAEGKLLVAGMFQGIGGKADLWSLARWDGSEFQPVAPTLLGQLGYPGFVADVVPYGRGFFVTGGINLAGDVPVSRIAWFDGERFHALGEGLSDQALRLLVHEDSLITGGLFLEAGGRPASGFAIWDFAR